MLKQIHKHQKFTIIILILLAGTMLLFGVDLGNSRESYALKINDKEISYTEYAQEKEQYSNLLKQQYGEAYKYILNNPNFSIDDKLKERIVPQVLITQKALSDDLNISNEVLQKKVTEIFSSSDYVNFLKYSGKSAKAFEEELRIDLVQELMSDFVKNMSRANTEEAKALWINEKQEYQIEYTQIGAKELKANIKAPTKEELEKIYEEQASTLETEAKIKYEYIKIGKDESKELVEVLPEDIELYYTENENSFREPKSAKINILKLELKVEEGPTTLQKIQESAEEILGEALAGTKLSELSKKENEYFNISLLKEENITEGIGSKEISNATFSLSEPGFTKLVKENNSYNVIDVKEIKEGNLKPLESVKNDIIETIKNREAPAYSTIYAEDLYNEWTESKKSLEEFAKDKNLKVSKTELLSFTVSPNGLNGLTEQISQNVSTKKQVIELNTSSVIVSIIDFKEREIPAFENVQEELKNIYEAQELQTLLSKTETEINEELKKEKITLNNISKKYNSEIITKEKISKLSGLPSEIISKDLSEVIFSTNKTPKLLDKAYRVGDSLIVTRIKNIKKPDEDQFKIDKKSYIEKSTNDNSELILASLIKKLKVNAEIDIRN